MTSLSAGEHLVELVMFENTGGSGIELYAVAQDRDGWAYSRLRHGLVDRATLRLPAARNPAAAKPFRPPEYPNRA